MLDKLLKKIGVKSYLDLNEEEKRTYVEWEEQLKGRKLTDEDVQSFLNTELDSAVKRLTDTDLSLETMSFRKAEVRFIKKMQEFLRMPEAEKRLIEKQLESKL